MFLVTAGGTTCVSYTLLLVKEDNFSMRTKQMVRISAIAPEARPTTEAGANLSGPLGRFEAS